jgi:asparagine synthase (glutamine-hydrolysing)
MLRRQLACSHPPSKPAYERRFPYLDRDLLEFLYAIPRDQLVRPTQRRSLMRRALIGIVPHEILNRRRKAFVTRTPVLALRDEWPDVLELTKNLLTSRAGIVEQQDFANALQKARQGLEINVGYMVRTLALEDWLQHMKNWSCLELPITANANCRLQEAECFPTCGSEVKL